MMEIFISFIIIVGMIILTIYLGKRTDKSRIKKKIEEKREFARQMASRHLQIIEESTDIINKTKKLDTAIGRFDTIFINIEGLKTLATEYQYPDIVSPPPEETEEYYKNEKIKFIKEFIIDEINRNIERAKAITRKSTKISLLDKSILLICDGKDLLKEEDEIKKFSDKEKELRELIEQMNKKE